MDNLIISRSIGILTLVCMTATLGQSANGQGDYVAYASRRCAPCADGVCRPYSNTFGYNPPLWKRWPEDTPGPSAGSAGNNRPPIEVPSFLPPRPADETLSSPQRPSLRRPVDDPNESPPAPPDTGVDELPHDPGPTPPPSEPPRPREDLILPGVDDQGHIRPTSTVQLALFSQDGSEGIPTTGEEITIVYEVSDGLPMAEEINIVYEVAEDYSVADEHWTDLIEPPATFDMAADQPTSGRRNPLR